MQALTVAWQDSLEELQHKAKQEPQAPPVSIGHNDFGPHLACLRRERIQAAANLGPRLSSGNDHRQGGASVCSSILLG